ncbi:hypothetical protein SNE40_021043 [Patella caerulea]|uniref:Uncharacterized protein n=1 Tax=Patella caerulea TaxID=87958 RepID=A0AAN8GD37_PATCE
MLRTRKRTTVTARIANSVQGSSAVSAPKRPKVNKAKKKADDKRRESTPESGIPTLDSLMEPHGIIEPLAVAEPSGNINLSLNSDCPTQIQGVGDTIADSVSQQIKTKIGQGEYVDLATLLDHSPPVARGKRVIIQQGQLFLEPSKPESKITTIEVWSDAFIVFMSIYCSIHKDKYPDLLKYMQVIRMASKRANDLGWKLYDEQYRLRKAKHPTAPWSVIDTELWLLYINCVNQFSEAKASMTFNSSTQNNRLCYSYNYNGQCLRAYCFYQNRWLRCFGNHPLISCSTEMFHNNKFSSGRCTGFRPATPRYQSLPRYPTTTVNSRFSRPQVRAPFPKGSSTLRYN